jgi:hypothetical protein
MKHSLFISILSLLKKKSNWKAKVTKNYVNKIDCAVHLLFHLMLSECMCLHLQSSEKI